MKYVDFNFDVWLKDYALLVNELITDNFNLDRNKEIFDEEREYFLNQQHAWSYESYCKACSYMRNLTNFNTFMAVMSLVESCPFSYIQNHFTDAHKRLVLSESDNQKIVEFLNKHGIVYTDDK